MTSKNFALVGAAGFIAPRHFKAIKETGNKLIAACDPHDSVGVIDSYFPEAAFFTEIERFDRHLEKLRRGPVEDRPHYLSVCSPNYLHDAHVRLALRAGADAICEKPLIITPRNLESLVQLEEETGQRIYNVLQLRLHPGVAALKQKLEAEPLRNKAEVVLSYVTRRGAWYKYSWKGSMEKSGGVAMNIGIHFFDMLIWLFGGVEGAILHLSDPRRIAGCIDLERARVRWFLSVEEDDLPAGLADKDQFAYRSLKIDGEEFDFSGGFTDLHTMVYQDILAGRGYGVDDARPALELVHSLRELEVVNSSFDAHPFLNRR